MRRKQRDEDFQRSQAWKANPGPSPDEEPHPDVEPPDGDGSSKEFIEGIIRMETAHGGLQRRVEEGDQDAIALRDAYLQIVKDSFSQPERFPGRLNEWIAKVIAWYEALPETVREEIQRHLPVPTKPLPPILLHASDPIHAAFIRSVSGVSQWTMQENFAAGLALMLDKGRIQVTIGLKQNDKIVALYDFFRKRGPLAVKAHYTLWSRWFEEGKGSGQYLKMSVNQFCADLGYTKHTRGGFRPEHKRQAIELFDAMTSLELIVSYTRPGTDISHIMQGPIWQRGIIEWERTPDHLRPITLAFMPGPYYQDAVWRQHHNAIGKISAGLMRLANDEDEWAILIGGYFGTIMRANQYRPSRLRIRTILERTNLAQSEDARRREKRPQEQFERALERLEEVGVITGWSPVGVDATELEDPDDPDAIEAYYFNDPLPKGDWRSPVIEISFPYDEDTKRLQDAKQKAINRRRKRAKPPK